MSLTIGSLCTGYGGLDAAVSQHYDARTVWLSEVDKNANQILTHHYPDVPNLGDLTVIDWDTVPKVDILTAGYPCQPFSQAGKRKGTADVRHLWPHIARAVDVLRPRICVFENVQGHLSKGGVEVVGSLTSMGYSVRWGLVRASDAGAPHRRARVFIVAVDRDTDSGLGERWGSQVTHVRPGVKESEAAEPSGTDRLAADTGGQRHGRGKTPEQWDDWTERMKAKHGNGNGHGKSLDIEAQRLLPTPTSRDHKDGASSGADVPVNALLGRTVWSLAPTRQPSDAGNPSSEGQHPNPPSPPDATGDTDSTHGLSST